MVASEPHSSDSRWNCRSYQLVLWWLGVGVAGRRTARTSATPILHKEHTGQPKSRRCGQDAPCDSHPHDGGFSRGNPRGRQYRRGGERGRAGSGAGTAGALTVDSRQQHSSSRSRRQQQQQQQWLRLTTETDDVRSHDGIDKRLLLLLSAATCTLHHVLHKSVMS
jgi:hypothetical protein